jgi:hypothetical protein
MVISRPVLLAGAMSVFGLSFALPLRSKVPDCTKQEQRTSKAPPKPIIPPSKLLYFCGPNRVPGRFYVKLKENDDLAKDVPSTVANELNVLPGLVPDTREKSISLGRALAEKYHAIFSDNHCRDDCKYFSVSEISDTDAAAMALDPRIEYMEPDKVAITQ